MCNTKGFEPQISQSLQKCLQLCTRAVLKLEKEGAHFIEVHKLEKHNTAIFIYLHGIKLTPLYLGFLFLENLLLPV